MHTRCMELSDSILEELRSKAPKSLLGLKEMFECIFPNVSITLIIGFDTFYEETFVHDAYLRNDQAVKANEATMPNSDPEVAALYSVITTTPRELKGSFPLLGFQKELVYHHLMNKIRF